LLQATEKMSADDFGAACEGFDRITPLDPWKISLLSAAKAHIPTNDFVDLA